MSTIKKSPSLFLIFLCALFFSKSNCSIINGLLAKIRPPSRKYSANKLNHSATAERGTVKRKPDATQAPRGNDAINNKIARSIILHRTQTQAQEIHDAILPLVSQVDIELIKSKIPPSIKRELEALIPNAANHEDAYKCIFAVAAAQCLLLHNYQYNLRRQGG
jgi:hypothetical protein